MITKFSKKNTLIFIFLTISIVVTLTVLIMNLALEKHYNLLLISFLSIMFLIILILSYLVNIDFAEFLNEVTIVTKAVRDGNLEKRIKIKKRDDISKLSFSINRMIDALQDRENRIVVISNEAQKSNSEVQAVFNSMSDGLITISSNCTIQKLNPIASIWIGLPEDSIVGKDIREVLCCKCTVDCKNKDNLTEICPYITKTERLLPTEGILHNLINKKERIVSIGVSPFIGDHSQASSVISLRDITKFKEIEEMRENFTATLTHDLRVPIIAEGNTLKLFLKGTFGKCNDKQKFAIENMLQSNTELLDLVNSLLDIYKYESGQMDLLKTEESLYELTQNCKNELDSIAKENKQTIINNVDTNLMKLSIDKKEIKRVIRNLLSNALKYSENNTTIEIYTRENDEEITLYVKDQGKGIPRDEVTKVFERFFSKAKKFRKVGSGLGLYLCKQIIEKHNGKIDVKSEVNKGSNFFFTLPKKFDLY